MSEQPVRILGIGGSMREGSMSLVALKVALKYAQEAGAETDLADVRMLALPVYDPSLPLEAYPASLPQLLAQVRAADALILCSPTYHGTVSGAVKNVLDALEFLGGDQPRYLSGRVVGLLGMGGAGAMNAVNALYHTARTLNGLTVSTTVIAPKDKLDAAAVAVHDDATEHRLRQMVGEIVDLAALVRQRRTATVG